MLGILLALAVPVPCTESLIEDDVVYEVVVSRSASRITLFRKPSLPPPAPVTAPRPRVPDLDPSPARHSGIDWTPRVFSRPPPL